MSRCTNTLVGMLRAGRIRTQVSKVVPFEQLPQALDDMEARTTTGRVVVRIGSPG